MSLSPQAFALVEQVNQLRAELERVKALYHELLYGVAKKFPNETRHQTALRYIQQAEKQDNGPECNQAIKEDK